MNLCFSKQMVGTVEKAGNNSERSRNYSGIIKIWYSAD